LDGAETDVDCGGGTCAACVTGRHCKVTSDCDQGSGAAGLALAGSYTGPVVVCDAATLTCTDVHVATSAYAGGVAPQFVSLTVAISGASPSAFTSNVLVSVKQVKPVLSHS
jgi:hypothetical protein